MLIVKKPRTFWHVVVKLIHFSIFCYKLKQELDQRSIKRLPIPMVCLHQQCEIRNVCENNNLKTVQISFLYQNGYAQKILKGQCFLNLILIQNLTSNYGLLVIPRQLWVYYQNISVSTSLNYAFKQKIILKSQVVKEMLNQSDWYIALYSITTKIILKKIIS